MSKVDLSPRPVEAMSPRQLERRQYLIRAALELVSEIGVERVQMKQVSERSGVALGTTYRYFSSKDHLLASAVSDWRGKLMADLATELRAPAALPSAVDTGTADRVVRFVHRGMRAFQRQPNLAHLLVSVTVSTDPFASEVVDAMAAAGRASLLALMPEVPPSAGTVLPMLIDSAWHSELVAWVTGRNTLADAFLHLDEIIRLLLAPYARG
ncbi:TetR/AcrR family transcriptional regulator [Streptacidiphilus sp. PB12-B1b]|uniref:TetR/AcrR family transcriptional regulator n=1 Tax=Streptacidiphilus sp. PB12-B1b TaxID=2705012 RepID=UPI0015FAC81F|nr:TetR/AcrR family transcriptional regulator [Streptacidiphilus sp. PB12-B1b]QMU76217.1 TetR/AcrR family transcriptional regulator [Streptacidiphilus sp. PB12-B1b]